MSSLPENSRPRRIGLRQKRDAFCSYTHGRRLSIESSPYAFSRQLAFEPLESRRLLATFAVTNLSDGAVAAVGDLPGSLRQAVFDANATVGSDEILFDVGLSGSILLTAGELALTSSVTINGPGTDQLTIDAQQNSRVLTIDDGNSNSDLIVSIDSLTLTGGLAADLGGGILNRESLTLSAVEVRDNQTLGLNSHGGGIFTEFGALTIVDSTIVGNVTNGENANGGGLFIRTAESSITNSTFSGNTAGNNGGGIFNVNRAMTVHHSTIVGNQVGAGFAAGIASGGNPNASTELYSSIVAGNGDGIEGEVDFLSGTNNSFVSLGYNVIGSGNALANFASPGDQINVTDPQVGSLADNGGPTRTHALLVGSPAIDAGDPSFSAPPTFDQRGTSFDRVVGSRIDVGSFERVPLTLPTSLTVDLLTDESDSIFTAGDLSLREAVLLANSPSFPGPDTIDFDASLFTTPQSLDLLLGEMEITEAVTIVGPGAESLTIDAQGNSRIFNITATSGDFTIEGLTLTDGATTADNGLFDSSQSGGAVRATTSGLLTLRDSAVTGSSTTGAGAEGGGIFAAGNVELESTTVSGNSTSGSYARGGGVFAGGMLTLNQSTISGNRTNGQGAAGGGVGSLGGLTVNDSLIESNSTAGIRSYAGGAFSVGLAILNDSELRSNTTRTNRAAGGGIFAVGAITVNRSTIDSNRTGIALVEESFSGVLYDATGGGISAGGDVTIDSSTVSNNISHGSASNGGGIFTTANVVLRNSTISGNQAFNRGEPVFHGFYGLPVGYRRDLSTIAGGVLASGSIVAEYSTIYGNSVSLYGGRGGGLVAYDSLTLLSSIVAGNTDEAGDEVLSRNGGQVALLGHKNPNLFVPSGLINASYSLIGDTLGTSFDPESPGTNLLNLDPRLSTLRDNGGSTFTHALVFGSPAIDAGDSSAAGAPANDQRGSGFQRLAGSAIDIGAYERDLVDPETIVVDTLSDLDNGDFTVGDLSLREALTFAQTNPFDPLIINFDVALAGQAIPLTQGELVVEKPIVLTGFAGNQVTIDAQQNSRVFTVQSHVDRVLLSGVEVANGSTSDSGGGIYVLSDGLLVIQDSAITGNSADSGGGIHSQSRVEIFSSVVSGNSDNSGASNTGAGGVYANKPLRIIDSQVTGNTGGGASARKSVFYNRYGYDDYFPDERVYAVNVTVTNSVVSGNTLGSGIYSSGTLRANNAIVSENGSDGLNANSAIEATQLTANNNAGYGIAAGEGGVVLSESTVSGNLGIGVSVSSAVGGYGNEDDFSDIYAYGVATISETTISNNGGTGISAAYGGHATLVDSLVSGNNGQGGIRVGSGDLLVRSSTVDGNTNNFSRRRGGGIYSRGGKVALYDTQVSNNRTTNFSADGGGIATRYGELSIYDSIVTGNSTSGSGSHGGGIYAGGTLRLVNTAVSGNQTSYLGTNGGGIYSRGASVTLMRSIVDHNSTMAAYAEGGGIFKAYGSVTLDHTTVSGNRTYGSYSEGGGIYLRDGELTLTSSTVSDNTTEGSSSDGGGIHIRDGVLTLVKSSVSGNSSAASGGGLYSANASVTLNNSTVSDNYGYAVGGISTLTGDITLNNSTVVENTNTSIYAGYASRAGIFSLSGSVILTNTVAAKNRPVGSSVGGDVQANAISANYSLIGNADGFTISGSGNLVGSAASPFDPELGPLASNGGPTLTHAPLPGSPVLDAGDSNASSSPDLDQRGEPFARVFNGRLDIGAVESQTIAGAPFPLVVDTTVDELDGDYSAGDLSLREAIGLANGSVGPDTITFDAAVFSTPQTILLTLGEFSIADDLTIVGPGAELLTIDAGNGENGVFGDGDGIRVFDIDDGDTDQQIEVTISGVTLTGGDVDGSGGAIRSVEGLQLDDVTVSDNFATRGGGGILVEGPATITRSTITGNQIDGNQSGGPFGDYAVGGGIYSDGELHISYSTISDNIAESSGSFSGTYGGGLFARQNATISHSTISGNQAIGTAEAQGGGIFSYTDALVSLTNSTVSGNSTSTPSGISSDGGGVFSQGDLILSHATVVENRSFGAAGAGGAIFSTDETIQIENTIIADNSVVGGAGEFRLGNSSLAVDYSILGDTSTLSASHLAEVASGVGNLINVDPQVGPLADNGGPTQTHLPQAGSPAIDAGDPGFAPPPDFDQRGAPFVRVAGGSVDIGAVEVQTSAAPLFVIDSAADQRFDYDDEGVLVSTTNLAAGNGVASGVAVAPDGQTHWVSNSNGNVFVYSASGTPLGQWDASGVNNLQGIATDGTDLWLVSNGPDRVYYFANGTSLTSGTHNATSTFDLDASNTNPFGITTDGAQLWVVNDLSNQWKTFVYDTMGTLLGSWGLDVGNRNARGITLDPSDPNDILIVNAALEDRIFRYENATTVLSGSLAAAESLLLDGANSSPNGIGGRSLTEPSVAGVSFDADNDIDGQDFLIWQQNYTGALTISAISTHLSTTHLPGDADRDGDVDADDLALWQEQYGGGVATSAMSSLPLRSASTTQLAAEPAARNIALIDQLFSADFFDPEDEKLVRVLDSILAEIGRRSAYRIPPTDDVFQHYGDGQSVDFDDQQVDEDYELELTLSDDWELI